MTTALHTCAAEACDKQIASRLLMCIDHWRMVPKALQRQFLGACRRYNIAARAHDRTAADIEAVKSARTAVITAVREKEIKRQLKKDSTGDVLNFE